MTASPSKLHFFPGASGNTEFWRPAAGRLAHPAQQVHIGWPGFGSTPPVPSVTGCRVFLVMRRGNSKLEQFERTKRYLARMENIYAGIFSSSGHDKDDCDDDVLSFFIHCYHVRDWIVHLNKVGVTARQVDLYINEHEALKICADLANGSKHCKLTRSLRTVGQPHIAGTERRTSTWLTGNGGGEVMQCKYTILSGAEFVDALQLARKCLQLWQSYMDGLKRD